MSSRKRTRAQVSKNDTHEEKEVQNEPVEKKRKIDPEVKKLEEKIENLEEQVERNKEAMNALDLQVKTFIASEIAEQHVKECWKIDFGSINCKAEMNINLHANPFLYKDGIPFTQDQVQSTIVDDELMTGITSIHDTKWQVDIEDPVFIKDNDAFDIKLNAFSNYTRLWEDGIFPNGILSIAQELIDKIKDGLEQECKENDFSNQNIRVDILNNDKIRELNLNHFRAILQNEFFLSEIKTLEKEYKIRVSLKLFAQELDTDMTNNVQMIDIEILDSLIH